MAERIPGGEYALTYELKILLHLDMVNACLLVNVTNFKKTKFLVECLGMAAIPQTIADFQRHVPIH